MGIMDKFILIGALVFEQINHCSTVEIMKASNLISSAVVNVNL